MTPHPVLMRATAVLVVPVLIGLSWVLPTNGAGGSCVDGSDGWQDIYGKTCSWYEGHFRANDPDGIRYACSYAAPEKPLSWFVARASGGLIQNSAMAACCACGGGTRDVLGGPADRTIGGSVSGDPHFIGFDGIKYDYTGVPGAFFNIISSPNYQLNGLLAPEVYNGLTYMSAVGLATSGGHRIKVAAMSDMQRLLVEIDDIVIDSKDLLGDGIANGGCTINALDSGSILVRSPEIEFVVHLHKGEFVDLETVSLLTTPDDAMHGVLGQTAASAYVGFEGKETDYIVSAMWSSDFLYNAFHNAGATAEANPSWREHKGKQPTGAREVVRHIVDNAPRTFGTARAFSEE